MPLVSLTSKPEIAKLSSSYHVLLDEHAMQPKARTNNKAAVIAIFILCFVLTLFLSTFKSAKFLFIRCPYLWESAIKRWYRRDICVLNGKV